MQEFEEIEPMLQARKEKKTEIIKAFRIPERMHYDLVNRAAHSGHKPVGYIRWVLAVHLYGVVRAAELGFERPVRTLEDDEDD